MPPIWNPNPSGLCLRPSVLWTLPTCVQTPLPLFSRWSPASWTGSYLATGFEVSRLLHDFTLLLLPGIPLLLLPALIPHPHPTQQTPISEFLSVTPSCFYPLFHKWNHHTLLLSCCLCPSLSPLTVSLHLLCCCPRLRRTESSVLLSASFTVSPLETDAPLIPYLQQ